MKRIVSLFLPAALSIVTLVSAQTPPAQSQTTAAYGNLPLSFEANRGQSDPSVQFLSHGQGYTLFLRQGEAVLALQQRASSDDPAVVRMQLAGASRHAVVSQESPQSSRTNYFIGNNPALWHADIPNYGRVRYTNVYDGIDLVYYGNQRHLEHDFVVSPNADPSRIALQMEGAKSLRIDAATGDLILSTGHSELRLLKPVTYQESNGQRAPVSSSYKLLAQNKIGFSIGAYNHAKPLVIDPVLVYSTYLGGSGSAGNGDAANGIAVDSDGSAYIVGTTYSANFPVTVDAHQSQNAAALAGHGRLSVFVAKLNPTGTALVYSTYLGGSGDTSGGDFGYAIALDASKNAYITGTTYSTDFPITCGAFQTANAVSTTGASTAFVTKLNAAGNGLAYSTYLGGQGNQSGSTIGDIGQAIAVNAAGDAYVTGYTGSSNFPTTEGVVQTSFAGNVFASNVFVTELNPSATELVYSTFLGGSGGAASGCDFCSNSNFGDVANGIAIDAAGDAFVAGSTYSTDFPVTDAAYQDSLNGISNAFVTELNPAGTKEIYSTYIGGYIDASARAIAVDGQGFAYIAGNTDAGLYPTTDGALEGPIEYGAFVTKLSQDGSSLVYSTYLEGYATSVSGLAVDSNGTAYIAGSAGATGTGDFGGFQATPDALATPSSTGTSAFLVKLDPNATVLNYATLLGGGHNDSANAIALDSTGSVYLVGSATSPDFPVTNGTFQAANMAATSGGNAFVSKFMLASEASQTTYPVRPPQIGTTLVDSGNDQAITTCYGFGSEGSDTLDVTITVNLVTSAFGPPPTGELTLLDFLDNCDGSDYTAPSCSQSIRGSWGGGDSFSLHDGLAFDAPNGLTVHWSAYYSGDSEYAPSNLSGSITSNGCPDFDANRFRSKAITPHIKLVPRSSPISAQSKSGLVQQGLASQPESRKFQGAKFVPAAYVADLKSSSSAVRPHATAACTAPLTPLTVKLGPVSASRLYGAANPAFTYKVTGLANGDSVSITPLPPGLQAAVGTYPVSASVGGAAAANYAVTVVPASLQIRKATALVYPYPATRGSIYGQPIPAMTGFVVSDLIKGDTQSSSVTGAPTLTTNATSKSPAGLYAISLAPGTLTSSNYALYLDTGRYYIYKAILKATIQNVTIHHGDAIPAFTYTLSGFVNGDSASTAVTGAPILFTTATSSSPPGKYKITGTLGTLTSQNYTFSPVYGTLTILP